MSQLSIKYLTSLHEGLLDQKDPKTVQTYDRPKQHLLNQNQNSISKGRTEILIGDQSSIHSGENNISSRRRSGSSIVVIDGDDLKPCLPDDYILNHQPIYSDNEDFDKDMLKMLQINQGNGSHREMAVDVPDSFIARNKTPPRYPPPRPPGNQKQEIHLSPKYLYEHGHQNHNHINHHIQQHQNNSNHKFVKKNDSDDSGRVEISISTSSNFENQESLLDSFCNELSSFDDSSKHDSFDSITFRNNMNSQVIHSGSMSTRSSHSDELPDYELKKIKIYMKHREMPVDVPESFVEIIKVPPRYPPPPHLSSRSSLLSQSNGHSIRKGSRTTTFSSPSSNSSSSTTSPTSEPLPDEVVKTRMSLSSSYDLAIEIQKPQPQVAVVKVNNDELNGSARPVPPPRLPTPSVPERNASHSQIAQIVQPTLEQLDSIKKYQEQLRRRREDEERIASQNEFLRNSLRGSNKLKSLQFNNAQPQTESDGLQSTGAENEAFIDDESAPTAGYSELVAALQRLQNKLSKSGQTTLAGRVTATQNILLSSSVANALAIRASVLEKRALQIASTPVANAQNQSKEIVEILAKSNSIGGIELANLLSSHNIEGLLLAHDRIASSTDQTSVQVQHTSPKMSPIGVKRSKVLPPQVIPVKPPTLPPQLQSTVVPPPLPPISSSLGTMNDDDNQIRIIKIEKSADPLGATIRNEGEAVVIGRIVSGGIAEKSRLLHEGDEILEVNGKEVRGKSINEVCSMLSQMQGTLTFLIVPNHSPPIMQYRDRAILRVRAHFDYDAEDDQFIPCKELGISFQKGDVLHVMSREDPNWWQAYREGEGDHTLAGLIPSQSFQHQREAMKLAIAQENGLVGKKGGKEGFIKGSTLLCARKGKKRSKKTTLEAGYPLYATTAPDEPDPEEILTYEEVALYYPRDTHKRPIVLIGPPNIGRHELRQRLMADSERFAAAVPHTSRSKRDGENDGQDYHFISRTSFEADILARRFVEHGEYEKAYYGTSLEAIRAVVASGKICVLNLHPQSLKLLRASDLKPYVVLVAPPSLEKLRQKKIRNGEPFKEEELKEIIATARDMEARWGHLFDMIIINNDTERAYEQLMNEINLLEREPQWVPASWVLNNPNRED
ncbi:MPP5 family protein [Megaselia abdita]